VVVPALQTLFLGRADAAATAAEIAAQTEP